MEETFHIDTVCHSGRPSDPRSAKETACYDLLDSLGIAYERVDHDAAMTMELCHAAEGVLHISICKNLFLCNRQKTKFYLLLMPGGKPFHTKDLSARLGCARLSFGPPEDMERLLGVTPGSATVLALQNDTAREVTLVNDPPEQHTQLYVSKKKKKKSSLAISTQDLTEKLLPALGHAPVLVDLPEDSDA